MKTYLWNGVIAPRILNLGSRWSSVVGHSIRREKNPHYPLDRRLDWPQTQSERVGEEKNIPATFWNGTPVVQLVAWSVY
jgi:hypothetical protein